MHTDVHDELREQAAPTHIDVQDDLRDQVRAVMSDRAEDRPRASSVTTAPTPSFSLIFFSISSAMSGLSRRKLRTFSLP